MPVTANREHPLRAFCLTIFLTLALLAPAAGWAQTPTDDVYDPIDSRTEERADASGNGGGGLPYTGGDIALVIAAGAAILGTGIVIRRSSRAG